MTDALAARRAQLRATKRGQRATVRRAPRPAGQQRLDVDPPAVDVHRLPHDGATGITGVVNREQRRRAARAAAAAGGGGSAGRRPPAASGGLDNTQSYKTLAALPQVSKAVTEARIAERYYLLDGLKGGVSTKKRVRQCKTAIGNSRVGVVTHEDSNGAHFVGVESCANVWCCPVCAPKIRAGRTADVVEAFERHQANGGGFAFLTQTLQHSHDDRLAPLLELLGKGWQYIANSRTYKAWKKRVGLVGNITALEVMYGVGAGWHPHRHMLLLTERPLSPDEVAALEAALHAVYVEWMAKRGRLAKERVGLRIDPVTDAKTAVAKYITKVQASFELTRADLKKTRASNKGDAPFDLLKHAVEGDPNAKRLWQEYEQAMTGKSAVRFSKGLRAHLGMDAAKTDEQLAEEEVGGDAGVYFSAPLFRRLTKDGHRAVLLWTASNKGDVGLLKLVAALYPGQYVADELQVPGAVVIE